MDHPSRLIIGVVHIELPLEVLYRLQKAVSGIGVDQIILIRVLGGGQIVSVISV